jgi:hypothetical protein
MDRFCYSAGERAGRGKRGISGYLERSGHGIITLPISHLSHRFTEFHYLSRTRPLTAHSLMQRQQNISGRNKRVSNACQRCRQHKIKCCGSQPCKACLHKGSRCSFVSEERNILVSERSKLPACHPAPCLISCLP